MCRIVAGIESNGKDGTDKEWIGRIRRKGSSIPPQTMVLFEMGHPEGSGKGAILRFFSALRMTSVQACGNSTTELLDLSS